MQASKGGHYVQQVIQEKPWWNEALEIVSRSDTLTKFIVLCFLLIVLVVIYKKWFSK